VAADQGFRKRLRLVPGESLPWSHWANEFRERLPAEIEAIQDEISAKSVGSDHRAAIRDRLNRVRELFVVEAQAVED
jgi:hypothetical protein